VRSSSWIMHHIPLHTSLQSTHLHAHFLTCRQISPSTHACCRPCPKPPSPFNTGRGVRVFDSHQHLP